MAFQVKGADRHANSGVAFNNVRGMLFAMIGFGEREGEVRVNFGKSKFVYDIDAHDWTIEDTAATIRAKTIEAMYFTVLDAEVERLERLKIRENPWRKQ